MFEVNFILLPNFKNGLWSPWGLKWIWFQTKFNWRSFNFIYENIFPLQKKKAKYEKKKKQYRNVFWRFSYFVGNILFMLLYFICAVLCLRTFIVSCFQQMNFSRTIDDNAWQRETQLVVGIQMMLRNTFCLECLFVATSMANTWEKAFNVFKVIERRNARKKAKTNNQLACHQKIFTIWHHLFEVGFEFRLWEMRFEFSKRFCGFLFVYFSSLQILFVWSKIETFLWRSSL